MEKTRKISPTDVKENYIGDNINGTIYLLPKKEAEKIYHGDRIFFSYAERVVKAKFPEMKVERIENKSKLEEITYGFLLRRTFL